MNKATGYRAIAAITLVAFASGCSTINPYTGERPDQQSSIRSRYRCCHRRPHRRDQWGQQSGAARARVDRRGRGRTGRRQHRLLPMDQQEAKLREQLRGTGVSVTRNGDHIILNMPGNVTFETNSSDLRPQFFGVLDSVALVINEFNKTLVEVVRPYRQHGKQRPQPSPVRAPRGNRRALLDRSPDRPHACTDFWFRRIATRCYQRHR